MSEPFTIVRLSTLTGYTPQLHRLLDLCYPNQPRDVFYRLVEQYRPGFPAWLALNEETSLIGFVHLAPNSKGGTLETLAVYPEYRGLGVARVLVRSLLKATPGLITLTTRIPDFFRHQGFEIIRSLPDASVLMIYYGFPTVTPLAIAQFEEAP